MTKTSKKEDTGSLLRVPNPKFTGTCEDVRTITLMESRGVTAEYCVTSEQIKAYLFDKTQWSEDEAKEWVGKHSKESPKGEVKAKVEITEKGKLVAIASTETPDREGESVSLDGWNLKNFKKNPVLLWMHNMSMAHNGLPIGKAENIKITKHGSKRVLQFDPVFDDSTDFNRTVKKFFEEGVMSTFSVGFIGLEREGAKFTKQELLEISAVPVPANAEAEIVQRALEIGVTKKMARQVVDIKSSVPFKSFELAPEDKTWDSKAADSRMRKLAGGPDKDKMDYKKYQEGFTWYDKENKTKFASYQLPHHDTEGGELITVWRGVTSAMAALLGSRGGVDIPEEDRQKVYNHLAKHYKEFDKTAPDFKLVETQELKGLFEQVVRQTERRNHRETKKHLREIRTEIRAKRADEKATHELPSDGEMVESLKKLAHITSQALERAKHLIGKEAT